MTKVNKWTLGLAAVGLVTLPATVQAEEQPNQILTALSSTTISGYVNTSMHWNPGSGNAGVPAYSYNGPGKSDGFNVNVVDLVIEKPLDEGTWSAGYKVELWYGPDSSGLGNNLGTSGGGFGNDLALKQAYVALRVPTGNGIDLKLGTFDTIIGYEVANAGGNPNYTRSWGYSIEPTQHTGLLAAYQVNDIIGISAGVANTWSAGINARSTRARNEEAKTWMGAITLTAPDDMGFLAGSSLYLGVVDGFNGVIGNDVTSYYAGVTLATPIQGVKLGAAFDYQEAHENNNTQGYVEAASLYASFQATEKLSLHGRGEWFKITAGAAGVGIPQEAIALTGTLQYDLWANVLSRLEVRWDRAIDGPGVFGGNTAATADDKDAFLVAANVIYKF
jgi:hypothetical protein